jgi:hypothetical protein
MKQMSDKEIKEFKDSIDPTVCMVQKIIKKSLENANCEFEHINYSENEFQYEAKVPSGLGNRIIVTVNIIKMHGHTGEIIYPNINAMRCPTCGSNQIITQESDLDRYQLQEKCSCNNCNSTWKNFYRLYNQDSKQCCKNKNGE